MSVAVTGGTIERRGLIIGQRRGGANHSEETTLQIVIGSPQVINLTTDLTTFSGGTATGNRDAYTLANGTEGHFKELLMLGTGEVHVSLAGTATSLTMREIDEYRQLRFKHGKWRQMINQASATQSVPGTGDPHYVSHDITHVTDLPFATGNGALAMGDGTFANGNDTFAIGTNASATGSRAMAFGRISEAAGASAIALGERSKANSNTAIAIGSRAESRGISTIAIGQQAQADGNDAICIGNGADTGGNSSIAIGLLAFTAGPNVDNIAIGNGAACNSLATDGIAIGTNASVNGSAAVAIGNEVDEITDGCTRLGGTGALTIPSGTTAERPTSVTAPRDGMIRFNSTRGVFEGYNGGWAAFTTATGAT